MPNWCICNLIVIVTGDPEHVRAFRERARGTIDGKPLDLTLDALVAHPDLPDASEEGYQWRLRTWGTKWDLDSVECYDCDPNLVEYQFATAWDSPRPWLRHVARMFPLLGFELNYAEPGLVFGGRYACSGVQVSDQYHTTHPMDYNRIVHDAFAGDPELLVGDDGDWDEDDDWEDGQTD